MTYTEQIELCIAETPGVVVAEVPRWCDVSVLPSYPEVTVTVVDADLLTCLDEHGDVVARCRLVG
jgi:hypothetical protein